MAKIEIRCTECGHEARVPDSFRGKKVRCLRCRAKLRIPGEEDERAPVAAKSEPNIRETRESPGTGSGRSGKRESRDSRPAKATRDPPHAVAGATSAKKRREVQEAIREVLGEYEHAI